MQSTHIVAFLIVVLVFLAVEYWGDSTQLFKAIIMLAGFGLVALMFRVGQEQSEHLEITRPDDNDVIKDEQLNFNIDDDSFSEYGNISQMNDLNPIDQRISDLDYRNPTGDIDNSDVIEDALGRGSSTFQPSNAQGVTPLSSAYYSHFTLAEPNPHIEGMEYSVPLNEAGLNADASLSRKQQHRSSINKRAIDGAVRSTRNKFQKYFQNELDESAELEWWSAEADDTETDFNAWQ